MGLDSMDVTGSQPPPVVEEDMSVDVNRLVIDDLNKRKEMGIAKYGKALTTYNGRNGLIDAYQEALDMTLYLRQQLEEEIQESCVPSIPIMVQSDITVTQIQTMGGDWMVAAAARVSHNPEAALALANPSMTKEIDGLISWLMEHRHGTPFEHAGLTFFVHAPIFVWREWHRHRVGFSYNEESGRYKQLDPVFWVPSPARKIVPGPDHTSARPKPMAGTTEQYETLVSSLTRSYHQAYNTYDRLLKFGIIKEVARSCLPVAIYSSCWVTCNPRSLMHFLSLRTHEPRAQRVSYPQAEIEQAARIAEDFLAKGWPITYEAFCRFGRVAP